MQVDLSDREVDARGLAESTALHALGGIDEESFPRRPALAEPELIVGVVIDLPGVEIVQCVRALRVVGVIPSIANAVLIIVGTFDVVS